MTTTEKTKKPLIKKSVERKPRAKKSEPVPDPVPEPKPAPKKTRRQTTEVVDTFAKQIIDTVRESIKPPKQVRAKRPPLSEEQKQVLRDRLIKAREAKVAKRGSAPDIPE